MKHSAKQPIRPTLIALGLAFAPVATVNAATMTWSVSAPTVDGADISNFIGASTDVNNISGGADSGTYTASNRDNQGQSFTTGSNAGGYTLNSITMQHVGYAGTSWSLDTGWNAFNGRFEISVGTVSLGILTDIAFETAAMVGTAPPNRNNSTGSAQYVTWTLTSPITLAANTTYAFSIDSLADQFGGPFMEFNGIGTTNDSYTGGGAFSENKATNAVTTLTGDRVFHLDIAAVPEPGTVAALAGSMALLLLIRRRSL